VIGIWFGGPRRAGTVQFWLFCFGPSGAADCSHGCSVGPAQPADAEPVEEASFPILPRRGRGSIRDRIPSIERLLSVRFCGKICLASAIPPPLRGDPEIKKTPPTGSASAGFSRRRCTRGYIPRPLRGQQPLRSYSPSSSRPIIISLHPLQFCPTFTVNTPLQSLHNNRIRPCFAAAPGSTGRSHRDRASRCRHSRLPSGFPSLTDRPAGRSW
jgi:hypothetical protein